MHCCRGAPHCHDVLCCAVLNEPAVNNHSNTTNPLANLHLALTCSALTHPPSPLPAWGTPLPPPATHPAELRDMSRKADAEKKEKEQAAAAIDDIEKAARERFDADQRAAQEAAGRWDWVEDSQYYYNAKHRCACAGLGNSRPGTQQGGAAHAHRHSRRVSNTSSVILAITQARVHPTWGGWVHGKLWHCMQLQLQG